MRVVPSPSPNAPAQPVRGLPGWARRPAFTVGLLAIAIVVSVVQGQPPAANRASGVSVPVRNDSPFPPPVGTVVVVTENGRATRFDTVTRRQVPLALPLAVTALRTWTAYGIDVVLGRLRDGRTVAYAVRRGQLATPLGPAENVVPSADGRTVWLAGRGTATRLALHRGQHVLRVRLPRAARLVADTPSGLVATTGRVPRSAPSPGPAPTTTPPTTTPPTVTSGARSVPDARSSPGSARPPTVPASAGTPGHRPTGTSVATPAPEPLAALLVRANGLTRVIAEAEALAATGDVVMVRRADRRLGVVSTRGGEPRWLPKLSAVEVTGPAALSRDGGETFAALARVNDHARMMVGPTSAEGEGDLNVVALEGGPPRPDAAPPVFGAAGGIFAVRPDGRVVYYRARARQGLLLGEDVPRARSVGPG